MKLFGTIFPFVESGHYPYTYGRHVANLEFFKALVQYGTFDEYHLFCMNTSHFQITSEVLKRELADFAHFGRVKLFLYQHLKESLHKRNYHVFHLGGWGHFFPGLAYLRNAHASLPFPITGVIHSLNGLESKYHAEKLLRAPLLPFDTIVCTSKAGELALKNIFTDAHTTLCTCDPEAVFKGSTACIGLGVSDLYFQKAADRRVLKQNLGLPPDSTVLLTVGRFSPQTKCDLYPLLQTFFRLLTDDKRSSLRLVLAGGGSENNQRLVQAMIREFGVGESTSCVLNMTEETKHALYSVADIYLSLSDNLQETFGISVVEAMAAGLPCIVSDIDGYRERISHNISGYIVPTLWNRDFWFMDLCDIMEFETMQLLMAQNMAIDGEFLFTCCSNLISKPELRTKMGTQAKIEAQRYRWSSIIGEYKALWDDLHHQALRHSNPLPIRNNPYIHDYTKLFGHYPSRTISDTDICSIGYFGRIAGKSGKVPVPYGDVGAIIDNKVVLSIISALDTENKSVKALLRQVSSVNHDMCRYTLLWMAKYSLIHINPDPQAA